MTRQLVGIALIVLLVLGKPRIHALVGMVIATIVMGFLAGLDATAIGDAILDGVAGTCKNILLPVSFGVMLGKLLEVTGGARSMAEAFIRVTGEQRSPWALALSGWLVAFPVFTDTGYIILNPLAKALSHRTRINMLYMGLALCLGLWPACLMAPPTPQPVAVAQALGVDMGLMTLGGGLFSLAIIVIGMIYVKWISNKIHFLPEDRGLTIDTKYLDNSSSEVSATAERGTIRTPSATAAILCILIPVILLMTATLSKVVFPADSLPVVVFGFIGTPFVAILIGLLMAMYWLSAGMPAETRLKWMESALSEAGVVVCITAAGGALGGVVKAAGIANTWANAMIAWGLPAWLLGFIIATLVKAAQGSAMISGVTAASIIGPLMPQLATNPLLMALAICSGAMFCSYFNDSLWWVFVRLTGLTMKEGLQAWTGLSIFCWAMSLPLLFLLSFVLV
ncbi:MAG: GntP family permease [bacterium]|jgi:GntP family gluconate:H+ symporter